MSDVDDIREMVRELNRRWVSGAMNLEAFFHPEMIMAVPGRPDRLAGRELCVRSYQDFTKMARIHSFDLDEPQVDVIGDIAVATCPFVIDYEIESGRWRGSGSDVLVLGRTDEGWEIVWRTMNSDPEEQVVDD